MTSLHVFDMDGTLLVGSSAGLQIAEQFGTLADLVDLERRLAAGAIDTRGFAVALHGLWRGLTREVVAKAFAVSPWLEGIDEVCADIRARGEWSVVVTMSADFFARRLLDFGFDTVVASRFPDLPLLDPVDPSAILKPSDKVRIADDLCRVYGLPLARCVAYGDSVSDVPLFTTLPKGVAVNADTALVSLAAATYNGPDLREAYALARSLLDQSAATVGFPQ